MFGSFKKIRRAFHIQTEAERELEYLNAATDRHDLEYRMRRIDRREFRRGF